MDQLISIIIPAFNAGETLSESMESALRQTHPNIEVVVIDDGSTDGTPDVAKKYCMLDRRCRYYRQKNSGPAAARNKGIENASGEFISFLDADDLWVETKLSRQLALIGSRSDAVVLTQLKRFAVEGAKVRYLTVTECPEYTTRKEYLNALLNLGMGEMAIFGTALVRRSHLEEAGGFDESIKTSEDWDLWMRLAMRYEFINIQEPFRLYRKHEGSFTRSYNLMQNLSNQIYIIDKISSSLNLSNFDKNTAKMNKYNQFRNVFMDRKNYLYGILMSFKSFTASRSRKIVF